MISFAPPVAQEPHSPDPRKTSAYQLALQAAVGLLMARGWVNWNSIRESLQVGPSISTVLNDLIAAGIIDDPAKRYLRGADPSLCCHVSADELITAWYRLDVNAAPKERGADQ